MNSYPWRLLSFLILLHSSVSAQKLKKADRVIAANIQGHVTALSAESASDKTLALPWEYVGKQFALSGLKPTGDNNTWYQHFEIYDGKEILPATHLTINDHKLKLFDDFFPFSFSANKNTEAAVAIALAENGVPWFKDLKELLKSSEDGATVDTLQLIRTKAMHAAEKGATGLIIYNSGGSDLVFDQFNRSTPIAIPVIFIRQKAFKKYCSDESEIIDMALNVEMKEVKRTGANVIGYADNNADSTYFISAFLGNDTDVAALMEIARLLRNAKPKKQNYLFVAYCGEKKGELGTTHLKQHPSFNLQKISRSIALDTVTVTTQNPKGLFLVKHSIEIIKNH